MLPHHAKWRWKD